ncbi:MAG: aldo/keto reductase [Candidatus Hatepunaea meridiana]|nr:aldo/keto reductase [Candidatus Hatepunaea meridiana]
MSERNQSLQKRLLGRTGFKVSPIGLGTVALGVKYGIEALQGVGIPVEDKAIDLIRHAVSRGVNLLDTAPGYGESERRIGRALDGNEDVIVATKVSIPVSNDGRLADRNELRKSIFDSIDNSRRMLRRDKLDLVQIHNATIDMMKSKVITDCLSEARDMGTVQSFGASVYGTEAALAAIDNGSFDMIQVAYNLLDRKMETDVFPRALEKNIGILVRSAFLKGALTDKVLDLPDSLVELKNIVIKLKENRALSWEQLPTLALRFCLTHPVVSAVLVGARSVQEIEQAIQAAKLGPLIQDELDELEQYAIDDERLTNPSYWPVM